MPQLPQALLSRQHALASSSASLPVSLTLALLLCAQHKPDMLAMCQAGQLLLLTWPGRLLMRGRCAGARQASLLLLQADR